MRNLFKLTFRNLYLLIIPTPSLILFFSVGNLEPHLSIFFISFAYIYKELNFRKLKNINFLYNEYYNNLPFCVEFISFFQ